MNKVELQAKVDSLIGEAKFLRTLYDMVILWFAKIKRLPTGIIPKCLLSGSWRLMVLKDGQIIGH